MHISHVNESQCTLVINLSTFAIKWLGENKSSQPEESVVRYPRQRLIANHIRHCLLTKYHPVTVTGHGHGVFIPSPKKASKVSVVRCPRQRLIAKQIRHGHLTKYPKRASKVSVVRCRIYERMDTYMNRSASGVLLSDPKRSKRSWTKSIVVKGGELYQVMKILHFVILIQMTNRHELLRFPQLLAP
jgi:hypothetical protein